MQYTLYEDYLQHYGIPGMRWGVHKAKSYKKKYDKATKKLETITDKDKKKELKTKQRDYKKKSIHYAKRVRNKIHSTTKAEEKKLHTPGVRTSEKIETIASKTLGVAGSLTGRALTGGLVGGVATSQYASMIGKSAGHIFGVKVTPKIKNLVEKEKNTYMAEVKMKQKHYDQALNILRSFGKSETDRLSKYSNSDFLDYLRKKSA